MRGLLTIALSFFLAASALAKEDWRQKAKDPKLLHRAVKLITDVMVHDIYSPPVASRIYAYVAIAGYEAAVPGSQQYTSLAGQLHDLSSLPIPEAGKPLSFQLASVHAVLTVGKAMVISEKRVDEFHKKMLQDFRRWGMPEGVFQNSLAYGKAVAEHVLAWSAKDHYKETRSDPKYSVNDEEGTWKPTPPAYMRAVEPNWNKIRPFMIDSAQRFKPVPPTPFSTEKGSRFYKEAEEVYTTGASLTPEQTAIADFWDCNPFRMNVKGHVMFAVKKISPGGHWINITALASKKAHTDFIRSAEAYACVAITLADAFISCWDEKYRSNVIRPETYINQYIDPLWTPLLQTPPFPEYTSGHSVVSAAAASVLTRLFGENFVFADSTEMEFGLPVRHFTSFSQAAGEAAISRFYGGIHYMPSITNGLQEGTAIGSFICQKLKTRKLL